MADVKELFPDITGSEAQFLQGVIKKMDDDTGRQFAVSYRKARISEQKILVLSLLGFLGIAGIQRFIIKQYKLGIVYLLTLGLLGIGTVVDVSSTDEIAFKHNQKIAEQLALTLNT